MDKIIMNQTVVQNSANSLQNLQFDVVAVPQNGISQNLDVRTGAVFKPVNIKITVRNKEEMKNGHGVISVPKLSTSGPKKVRLVSSDQTIISFDLFMGSDNEKKFPKKSHSKFLQLFKASGCFNNQNDDDDCPYLPSSPNGSCKTKSVADVHISQDGKKVDERFTLKKNLPPMNSTNSTLRTSNFLGKCKPGGCLDPPFDEDKYIYKHKLLEINQKHANVPVSTDEKHIEDNIISKKIVYESGSTTKRKSSNSSVEEIYHNIITYPPALSPSEMYVQEETQSKKSNLTTSSENKVRKSFNEFLDTYFMPTRRKRSKIDVKLSTEVLKNESMSYNSNNTNADTRSLKQQKEPSQVHSLSNEEILNQALETKISLTNVKDKNIEREKMESSEIVPKTFCKLSETNIQVPQDSLTELILNDDKFKENRFSSSAHKLKLEDTENLVLDTFTVFESNVGSSKVSLYIHKDTTLNEELPKITSKGLKDEKNGHEIIENNNLHETHEIVSTVENETLTYNISKTDVSKAEELTPSDNVTLSSSYTVPTEYLQETDNCPLASNDINHLKRKYTKGIHEMETANNDYEDAQQKPIISSVENEARKRYKLSNIDKNELNLKPLTTSDSGTLTSTNPVFPEHILKTEVLPQVTYTKPLKIYKHLSESIDQTEAVTFSRSQASLLEQIQVIDITGQNNVKKIKTSQALVDTATNKYVEKIDINDLHGLENANNIECKDDHEKLIISTAQKEPLKYNLSSSEKNEFKLKPLAQFDNISLISTNTTVSTTGNKYEEKIASSDLSVSNIEYRNKDDNQKSIRSSSVVIAKSDLSLKSANLIMNSPYIIDSKIISDKKIIKDISQVSPTLRMPDKETEDESFINNKYNLATNQSQSHLSPTLVLQEKKREEKYTNNEEPVYYEPTNGSTSSQVLNLSSLINVPSRAGTPSGHLQVNIYEDDHGLNSNISLKSHISKEDTGNFFLPKLQESRDKVMLETIPQLPSKTSKVFLSESDSDLKPIKLNIPKENLENLGAVFKNEDKNEFMTINDSEVDENFDENKKSSMKIDFGFHSFVDDKNETLIRTFDANKHPEFGPLDKITVIKSTIRANDNGIRIPVTSKTDITLQIRKLFNEGNNAKRDVDNTELTNKVPEKSLSKTILLKETLDSVYENLIPIQNIIINLKQEAEFLTREQVLLRKILNELKNKSTKMSNAIRKCNCNKL